MWSEWLARTLKPRRAEDAPRQGGRPPLELPELEGNGMHPGADDFRSAVTGADVGEPVG